MNSKNIIIWSTTKVIYITENAVLTISNKNIMLSDYHCKCRLIWKYIILHRSTHGTQMKFHTVNVQQLQYEPSKSLTTLYFINDPRTRAEISYRTLNVGLNGESYTSYCLCVKFYGGFMRWGRWVKFSDCYVQRWRCKGEVLESIQNITHRPHGGRFDRVDGSGKCYKMKC